MQPSLAVLEFLPNMEGEMKFVGLVALSLLVGAGLFYFILKAIAQLIAAITGED